MGRRAQTNCTSVAAHIPMTSITVTPTPLSQLIHNSLLLPADKWVKRLSLIHRWMGLECGCKLKIGYRYTATQFRVVLKENRENSPYGQIFRQCGKRSSQRWENTLAHGSVGWLDWFVRVWKEKDWEQGGLAKKGADGPMRVGTKHKDPCITSLVVTRAHPT